MEKDNSHVLFKITMSEVIEIFEDMYFKEENLVGGDVGLYTKKLLEYGRNKEIFDDHLYDSALKILREFDYFYDEN